MPHLFISSAQVSRTHCCFHVTDGPRGEERVPAEHVGRAPSVSFSFQSMTTLVVSQGALPGRLWRAGGPFSCNSAVVCLSIPGPCGHLNIHPLVMSRKDSLAGNGRGRSACAFLKVTPAERACSAGHARLRKVSLWTGGGDLLTHSPARLELPFLLVTVRKLVLREVTGLPGSPSSQAPIFREHSASRGVRVLCGTVQAGISAQSNSAQMPQTPVLQEARSQGQFWR